MNREKKVLNIELTARHEETDRRPLDAALKDFQAALERAGYLQQTVDVVLDVNAPPPAEPEPEPEPEPQQQVPPPPPEKMHDEVPGPSTSDPLPPGNAAETVTITDGEVGQLEDEIPGL